ncbi:MAG: DegT/DnrJ/EryC1/StrS aminotransferase family protein [Pseudomonadota bacterium]
MLPFIDLQAQRARIEDEINSAVMSVIESGRYVLGPEVAELEQKLATFSQAKRCVACANGTEALALPLMAWEIGPDDAVFCPSFTFAATGEVIPWLGASPVFVDIDPVTYNIDPKHLEAAIEQVKADGKLTPKAIIAVDLFGQPADYPEISRIAKAHGLKLIADSAQGFGCTLNGKHPMHWADAVTTSFFPAKPLGCYGDGGAVLTNDDELADLIDSLHVHGKATPKDISDNEFEHDPKYFNMRIGMNSRLDTIQAAILLEKLKVFDEEIMLRDKIAARYNELLAPHVLAVPGMIDGGKSVWAQYTIEHENRDALGAHLKTQGVPSAVYYPMPMHKQGVYAPYPVGPGGLPVTDAKSKTVISLPMHPYLSEADQDKVVNAVRSFAA